MRIVINIEKKHLYFLIIFLVLAGIGVVIASTWDGSQSHSILWTTDIKGKNVNTINLHDTFTVGDPLSQGYIITGGCSAGGAGFGCRSNSNFGNIIPGDLGTPPSCPSGFIFRGMSNPSELSFVICTYP